MLIDLLLIVISTIVLIPVLTFCAECLVAYFGNEPLHLANENNSTENFVVLMPAHNEEAILAQTLSKVVPLLSSPKKLFLVADNCTDATVNIGKNFGVTVLERHDTDRRGKGYALDYGVGILKQQEKTPAIVIILDADCQVVKGSLANLAATSQQLNRPVQAAYLMEPSEKPDLKQRISAFAFRVKNLVRLKGSQRLGIPCLLTGSGMAFPWKILAQIPLASGNIVEDMQLGIDLALIGHHPAFAEHTVIESTFPTSQEASSVQRTRWEHGHLQTIRQQVPRLLRQTFKQRQQALLGLALDIAVPPLTLLIMLWSVSWSIGLVWFVFGGSILPFALLSGGGILLTCTILLVWLAHGRELLPLTILLTVPIYVLGKLPLYFRYLLQPQKTWQRTEKSAK